VGDEEDAFMTPFHSKSPLPGCWLILGIPIPSVSTTRLHSIRPVYAGPGGCGILS
jgi:hypothetical protein